MIAWQVRHRENDPDPVVRASRSQRMHDKVKIDQHQCETDYRISPKNRSDAHRTIEWIGANLGGNVVGYVWWTLITHRDLNLFFFAGSLWLIGRDDFCELSVDDW